MNEMISRRNILKTGCAAAAGVSLSNSSPPISAEAMPSVNEKPAEWRNRQPGMAYRRLGRTGYMVSEIIMGGNTIATDNNKHVEMAVEMGLNYFDTAPAYGGGRSEEGYGELLKRPSFREKVFVNLTSLATFIFENSKNTSN